jgi:hypothetical protein
MNQHHFPLLEEYPVLSASIGFMLFCYSRFGQVWMIMLGKICAPLLSVVDFDAHYGNAIVHLTQTVAGWATVGMFLMALWAFIEKKRNK